MDGVNKVCKKLLKTTFSFEFLSLILGDCKGKKGNYGGN